MARYVHYEVIEDIFSNNGVWEMDFLKLSDLTSEYFVDEIFDVFDEYCENMDLTHKL
jgi:hypothetical protein